MTAPSTQPWYLELATALATGRVDRAGAVRLLGARAGEKPTGRTLVAPAHPELKAATVYALPHVAIDLAIDVALADAATLELSDLERVFGPARPMARAPDDFASGDKHAIYYEPPGGTYRVRIFAELRRGAGHVLRAVHFDRERR